MAGQKRGNATGASCWVFHVCAQETSFTFWRCCGCGSWRLVFMPRAMLRCCPFCLTFCHSQLSHSLTSCQAEWLKFGAPELRNTELKSSFPAVWFSNWTAGRCSKKFGKGGATIALLLCQSIHLLIYTLKISPILWCLLWQLPISYSLFWLGGVVRGKAVFTVLNN